MEGLLSLFLLVGIPVFIGFKIVSSAHKSREKRLAKYIADEIKKSR